MVLRANKSDTPSRPQGLLRNPSLRICTSCLIICIYFSKLCRLPVTENYLRKERNIGLSN